MDADDMRDIALQAFCEGGRPLAHPPSSPAPVLVASPGLWSWQRYIPLMVQYVRRLQEDVVDLRLYGTTVEPTTTL